MVETLDVTASPRGYNKTVPAIMVGEFSSTDGSDYVMLVNLSLAYSAKYQLKTAKNYKTVEKISPIDGLPSPTDFEKFGEWLLPGHGILLKMNPGP